MTNRQRIETARRALAEETAQDRHQPEELIPENHQTALVDLLANLQHYAAHHELEFDAAARKANGHFTHETRFGLDEEAPAF